MITVDNNISYADLQAFVNEGVNVNSSNGMIVSAGTPEQIETRAKTIKGLSVVLDNLQKTESDKYFLGIFFRLENRSTGLLAVPVVSTIYWNEDAGHFIIVKNVEEIPSNWLAIMSNVRNNIDAWSQGTIKSFSDAWPKGFIEAPRPDRNE